MKNKLYRSLSILGVLLCASSGARAEVILAHVKGMVCAFCVQGVKRSLQSNDAVKSVDLNLNDKVAVITVKDGKKLSDDQIRYIVHEAGYDVEGPIQHGTTGKTTARVSAHRKTRANVSASTKKALPEKTSNTPKNKLVLGAL